MEIRSLDMPDFEPLFALVLEVYSDSPESMWFSSAPTREGFRFVFRDKIEGIVLRDRVDLVAVENGRILGECEIVRRRNETGVLGIIISREQRRKGLGSSLLSQAAGLARRIGITRLRAEISGNNGSAMVFLAKRGFSMNGTMPKESGAGLRNITLMLKEL